MAHCCLTIDLVIWCLVDSGRPSTPVPGPSKPNGQSSSGSGSCKEGSSGRPPSPVLPRKKSGGSGGALRNCSGEVRLSSNKSRRLNFRRDSSSTENDLFAASRKKSLTWSENETGSGSSSRGKKKDEEEVTSTLAVNSDKPRRGSRKSGDFTEAGGDR